MKHKLVWPVIWWGCLVGFMVLTRPNSIPVGLLIVPYALFGVAIYSSWVPVMTLLKIKRTRHNRLLGMIVTTVLLACVGLQSLGELTLKDSIVVLLFATVSYFYIARNTP